MILISGKVFEKFEPILILKAIKKALRSLYNILIFVLYLEVLITQRLPPSSKTSV